MYISQNKKSRFWSETQKNLNKVLQEGESLDQINNEARFMNENQILRASTKVVPESIKNDLFDTDREVEDRRLFQTPNQLDPSQNYGKMNNDFSSDQSSGVHFPRDSLLFRNFPKISPDASTSQSEHQSFKS